MARKIFISSIVLSIVFWLSCYPANSLAQDDFSIRLQEDGKHGPIIFLVTISPDGKIKDVTVLENKEIRGSGVTKKRFLKQFIGKSLKDELRLGRDIDAITGATVSSEASVRAVKKALAMWKETRQ